MVFLSRLSKTKNLESGQALLIVLLSMAVILTVVLSILSTSVTDIAVTSREEEALRAFSAAEAGVEQSLIVGGPSSGDFEQSTFNATVTGVAEGSQTFAYPQGLLAGDVANVWFVAHDGDGNIICSAEKPCFTGDRVRLCWGEPGTLANENTTPAIEATVYYLTTPGNYGTTRVARAALDPNNARTLQNFFTGSAFSNCTVENKNYPFQSIINFSALSIPASSYTQQGGLQFMSVRLLYNSNLAQSLAVDANFSGNTLLPSQGSKVESVGTAGESTRKIEVYKLYTAGPSVFSNSVFSLGGISQ